MLLNRSFHLAKPISVLETSLTHFYPLFFCIEAVAKVVENRKELGSLAVVQDTIVFLKNAVLKLVSVKEESTMVVSGLPLCC